jgi:hypothetical protein
MSVDPKTVLSPRSRLKSLNAVLRWAKNWSLAVGTWDELGNRVLLVRWNGDKDRPLGNPVSHGYPTWFVMPDEFHHAALEQVSEPNRSNAKSWLNGGDIKHWDKPTKADD